MAGFLNEVRERIEYNKDYYSYAEIARDVGITGSMVSHIVAGRRGLGNDTVARKLFEALSLDPEEMMIRKYEEDKNVDKNIKVYLRYGYEKIKEQGGL